MRYAIISDIHSNAAAFQAVIEYLKTNPVDRIACCGDVTGYGPDPKECIALFKSLKNAFCTAGNHDRCIAGKLSDDGLNVAAAKSDKLNREAIGPEEMVFLNSLRAKISESGLLFVHGSPKNPVEEYLFKLEKFAENMSEFSEKICFVGHTHQPIVFYQDVNTFETGFVQVEQEPFAMQTEDNKRYIINVGSVGQPRDRNPKACMAFYDTDTKTISFKRLEYDVAAVAEKMTRLGYPAELCGRLMMGI